MMILRHKKIIAGVLAFFVVIIFSAVAVYISLQLRQEKSVSPTAPVSKPRAEGINLIQNNLVQNGGFEELIWAQGGGTDNMRFRSPSGCGNSTWYAGATTGNVGVWKSSDGARTWSRITALSPEPYPVIANPANCNQAFVSVWGGGVYRINGSSAQLINSGLGETYVYGLAITGTTLYAGTRSKGIYKTDINAVAWQKVNTGIDNKKIRSLTAIGSRVYAGARGCTLYTSENAGASWSKQVVLSGGCDDAQVWSVAEAKGVRYAGLNKGLYYNAGSGWQKVNAIPNNRIDGIAYDGMSGYFYVSTYGAGIYRCNVGANGVVQSCTQQNLGLTALNMREIKIHNGLLVAGSDDGVWYLSSIPGWSRSEAINPTEFYEVDCTVWNSCTGLPGGTHFLKMARQSPGDGYVASDWTETGSNLTNRSFILSFWAKSHAADKTISNILIQRYPKGGDWTGTGIVFGPFTFVPGAWTHFQQTVTFPNPGNGSTTSQIRAVLRPPADNSNSPVYYDEVSLTETTVVPTPTSIPTSVPTTSPSPTPPIPTPTPTPPVTPTPTPTLAPGQAGLTFKIKFQGITSEKPSQIIKMLFQYGDSYDVQVVSDGQGVYSGTISGINPGTYDMLIKGWSHLQKKFSGIVLNDGENAQDWSSTALMVGDFNNDNILNIADISALLAKYTALSVPVDESNHIYDVNLDNQIDISDIALVLSNYTQLEVQGDEYLPK